MISGQPYRCGALRHLIPAACALAALSCGGGTSVTEITGPDPVRCQVALSTENDTVPADGGTITVNIEAERDCTWDAASEAPWLTLAATNGQGAAAVDATVAASEQNTARTAAIVVNDARLEIAQEARPCTFALESPGASVSAAGGEVAARVETSEGCSWQASTEVPWISVPDGTRTGSGTVRMQVAFNGGPAREGVVELAGRTFTVAQSAQGAPMPPECAPTVTPDALEAPAGGATRVVGLTVADGCAWTASSAAAWINVSPVSGQGNAEIRVAIAANTAGARTGSVTIAGREVPVQQAAATAPQPCTYAIEPGSRTFPGSGGEAVAQVTTQSGCEWSAASEASWIAISVGRGSGSGEVRYVVQPNPGTDVRRATIVVAGRSHEVTQQGAAPQCTVLLMPASLDVPPAGGEGRFSVATQATCAWSASTAAAWITIETASGTGPGEVVYTAAANTTGAARTAQIAVGGRTHTVKQAAGQTCTYALDPGEVSVEALGGRQRFSVRTENGCAWTASADADWIVLEKASGTGTDDVIYRVAPNIALAPRSASIVVAGRTHTVTQAAAVPVCDFTLSPSARTIPAAGGEGRFDVTTLPLCGWSASTGAPWVTLTEASGTGSGTVVYTVEPNTAGEARTATIVVGGQPHVVTQEAGAPPSSGP